jgi:hypothetical protein
MNYDNSVTLETSPYNNNSSSMTAHHILYDKCYKFSSNTFHGASFLHLTSHNLSIPIGNTQGMSVPEPFPYDSAQLKENICWV